MIVSSKIRFVQVANSKSPGRPGLHIMLVVLWPNPPNPPFSEYHGPSKILSAATKKEMEIYIWIFQGGGFFRYKAEAALAGTWGMVHSGTFRYILQLHLCIFGTPFFCISGMLPTKGSSWPALIQKRHVSNRGIQLTCFDPKTSRH